MSENPPTGPQYGGGSPDPSRPDLNKPEGGYPPPGNYPPPPGSYPPPPANYPPPAGSYPPPPGAYPPPPGSYPPPPGAYPPPQPNYSQPQGGYPPPPAFAPGAGYGTNSPLANGATPGSLGLRFLARLIDGLLVGIVAFIIYLILPGGVTGTILFGIIAAGLQFGYFVYLESTKGQTFGKQWLGLRVLGAAGGNPTQNESIKRNAFLLLSIIPFLGSFLLFIAEIVIAVTVNSSATKQGKHDEIAGGTQVIKVTT